ncbi:hypothetical protein CQW23_24889 [Capsicum baccatum]|uniref:VQ domain-containing protein n=1 Tax=Capsicum baccatum TaxID=33114 RepID=A0A2G2VW15_CAPBA|nr:calmodulin-binding protein 25 [Capsicum annuum]KAF3616488.1 putative protein sym-1 [Capsicum annuum]KAF3626666.1 putative protein sym-1 [Capsicum annuum]PHT37189.1 hypothetical protein CQW23_24889 [Capsicum baccatum]
MAASDNLMTMESWAFRSAFTDSWFSDVFTKETETLTKVLQNSVFPDPDPNPFQTSTGSGRTISGGSENETTGSTRRSKVGVNGKITKRKSRASRRNTTTYITADVDNFRHMVQQVTGVRFMPGEGQLPVGNIVRPEPQRVGNRLPSITCLPTLDTSAFLLDPTSGMVPTAPPSAAVTQPENVVVDGGSCGYDFSSFAGFPTLESFMESNVV